MKEFRTHHTKICCLDILIILSYRHLKNNKYKERLPLNYAYVPKDSSSKKNPIGTQLL